MSNIVIAEVLLGLSNVWEDMLVPKFKKKKWKNLKKHLETISSDYMWSRELSNYLVPFEYHYTMNPLTDAESEKVLQEGIRLFHEGKASQVMFLSMFYERIGGPTIENYDLPDTPDEIRCKASFLGAVVKSALEVGETFLYCYEAVTILTGSRFQLGQGFFNMKQNAMVFITNQRILIFGGFPDIPPKKLMGKKIHYAIYRLYNSDIEENMYRTGLDIIDRDSIVEVVEEKNMRGKISFNADYLQAHTNIPVSFSFLFVTAIAHEVDKRRKHVRTREMSYFFKLKTKEELQRFLERVNDILLASAGGMEK